MNTGKLSFNEQALRALRNQLMRLETELEEVKITLSQTDRRLIESLRSSSREAYKERVKKIDQDFESSIQNLSALIKIMEQSNQNMFTLDRSIDFTLDFVTG